MFKKLMLSALSFLLVLNFSAVALAIDTNIDGGGGSTEQITGETIWQNPQMDGVRISIVDVKTKKLYCNPMDFTNYQPSPNSMHFGKVAKLAYKNGVPLRRNASSYTYKNPKISLPRIVSISGGSNIATVKRYFGDENALKYIAKETGIAYDKLISGKYKLLLEPIAYFKYNGQDFACTSTELALYDEQLGGRKIYLSKIGQLSHKNLPLSMFLEKTDLGIQRWSGTRTGIVKSNSSIIGQLGVGIISFDKAQGEEEQTPSIEAPDLTYHTDIDVYTSFKITATSDITSPKPTSKDDLTPSGDEPTATITVGNKGDSFYKSETINYYVPAGKETTVFIKWHTPKEPQDIPIKIDIEGGGTSAKTECTASIIEIYETEPPDPRPKDKRPKGFRPPTPPSKLENTKAEWVVYTDEGWHWEKNIQDCGGYVTNEETGEQEWEENYQDLGNYEHDGLTENKYEVTLSASSTLSPDEYCRTYIKKGNTYTIKSGYGLQLNVTATTGGGSKIEKTERGERTNAQGCVAVFPEFNFETYNRFLIKPDIKKNKFVFKNNKYAYNPAPVHFTPLWYPDNSKYWVRTYIFDVWTPAGMLYSSADDFVNINGDCYDDWTVTQSNNNQSIIK